MPALEGTRLKLGEQSLWSENLFANSLIFAAYCLNQGCSSSLSRSGTTLQVPHQQKLIIQFPGVTCYGYGASSGIFQDDRNRLWKHLEHLLKQAQISSIQFEDLCHYSLYNSDDENIEDITGDLLGPMDEGCFHFGKFTTDMNQSLGLNASWKALNLRTLGEEEIHGIAYMATSTWSPAKGEFLTWTTKTKSSKSQEKLGNCEDEDA